MTIAGSAPRTLRAPSGTTILRTRHSVQASSEDGTMEIVPRSSLMVYVGAVENERRDRTGLIERHLLVTTDGRVVECWFAYPTERSENFTSCVFEEV